jgi:hypothetical protein
MKRRKQVDWGKHFDAAYMEKKTSMKPKKEDKTVPNSLLDWGEAIMTMPRANHWTEDFMLKCSCGGGNAVDIPLSKYSNIAQCGCGKMYYIQFDGTISELVKTKARLVKKNC